MRKKLFAWASLATALLIAAVFGYSVTGGSRMREDPFRTDLMDFPAYVKNGFEPAYVSLNDPDRVLWDMELPARHGPILMSHLPDEEYSPDGSVFLSRTKRKV